MATDRVVLDNQLYMDLQVDQGMSVRLPASATITFGGCDNFETTSLNPSPDRL